MLGATATHFTFLQRLHWARFLPIRLVLSFPSLVKGSIAVAYRSPSGCLVSRLANFQVTAHLGASSASLLPRSRSVRRRTRLEAVYPPEPASRHPSVDNREGSPVFPCFISIILWSLPLNVPHWCYIKLSCVKALFLPLCPFICLPIRRVFRFRVISKLFLGIPFSSDNKPVGALSHGIRRGN